nr:immunoglobulin heavy chain junction region [Mus musculus]
CSLGSLYAMDYW